jgi:hypothetical protein
VSEPALSVAFFDSDRRRYVLARSGATLLFDETESTALAEGVRVDAKGEDFEAELEGRMRLTFSPVSPAADLVGTRVRVCRASGELDGQAVDGLGTVSETERPPAWDELDALRAISVLVDEQTALLAVSRRPRGSLGHGQELVDAVLLQAGELVEVENARISTVYDGEGRQRSAGLELWLPGEDFPRRGTGTVAAGSSLQLSGLRVHAAVFNWRLEEREGVGQYELAVRAEEPQAA